MFEHSFDILRHKSVVDIIQWRARHQHANPAYTFLDQGEKEQASISYGELDHRARNIAHRLFQEGLRPGSRAILLFPTGLNYISAFIACLYAGIIAIPAYPPQRKRYLTRLLSIVSDAQPSAILSDDSTALDISQLNLTDIERDLKTIILCDDFSSLSGSPYLPALTAEMPAFLQYTSGSTSQPKGVIVSHGNLVYNQEMIRAAMGHDESSTFVSWLPLFHDMGLIGNMLQPLYLGAHSIFMRPEDFLQKPFRWLKAISTYRAHTSGAPNFAYDLCVEKISAEEKRQLNLSNWRVAYNGSEPVRAETLSSFIDAFSECGFEQHALYPCYGLAEATLFVSGGNKTAPPRRLICEKSGLDQNRILICSSESELTRTLVSCGQSWLDEKIIIVDREKNSPCINGQVGEIWLAGPNITSGYWHNTNKVNEIFNAKLAGHNDDVFFRTGDLGFIHDSELYVTGRLKDLIVVRGANHYPQDIEFSVANCHPGLSAQNGAAFSIDHDDGEQLIITFELNRAYIHQQKNDEIFETIRQTVSKHHDLQVFAIALLRPGKTPKTSSGKIQRHLCRKGFLDNSLAVLDEWRQPDTKCHEIHTGHIDARIIGPPFSRDVIQEWLVAKLSEGLQITSDEIDVTQSFAYYGLDSSVAIMLTGELSTTLNSPLEATIFWEYPTIQQLAKHVEKVANT